MLSERPFWCSAGWAILAASAPDSRAVPASPLAPRPVTSSGHHRTPQLSCSLKQQSHPQEVYRKKASGLVLNPTNLTLEPDELQCPTHRVLPFLASWHCCSFRVLMLHGYSEIPNHVHLNVSFFHTQNLKLVCEKAIYECIFIYKGYFIKE